jgi:hypothetical protein
MRILLAAFFAAPLLLAGMTQAGAEKRIFIIANSPDNYGVDRCLATGQACGAAAASAYCQSKQFNAAASYRKVDRDEITGAVPTGTACGRSGCDEFVAIECTR